MTFYRNVKKDSYIKDLDFNAKSVQSIPWFFKISSAIRFRFYDSYCHRDLFKIESVFYLLKFKSYNHNILSILFDIILKM